MLETGSKLPEIEIKEVASMKEEESSENIETLNLI